MTPYRWHCLSFPLKCRDYRHVPPWPLHSTLGIKPWASCMLDRNGDSQATPVVSPPHFQMEKITTGISVMGFKRWDRNASVFSGYWFRLQSRKNGAGTLGYLGLPGLETWRPCALGFHSWSTASQGCVATQGGSRLWASQTSVFWNLLLFVTVKTVSGQH